jgi:hypothetical protein
VTGAVLASVGSSSGTYIRWLQCSHCHHPAVQDEDNTYLPGKMFGPVLEGLPAEVDRAYDEVRRCMAANAFTAAEALCRKILMHIAVDKGAEEGGSFISYIAFLESTGYVTPPMKDWVGLIREHGNEANHRLAAPEESRAQGTVYFTSQLLRSVYEMEFLATRFGKPAK